MWQGDHRIQSAIPSVSYPQCGRILSGMRVHNVERFGAPIPHRGRTGTHPSRAEQAPTAHRHQRHATDRQADRLQSLADRFGHSRTLMPTMDGNHSVTSETEQAQRRSTDVWSPCRPSELSQIPRPSSGSSSPRSVPGPPRRSPPPRRATRVCFGAIGVSYSRTRVATCGAWQPRDSDRPLNRDHRRRLAARRARSGYCIT
jgi:hypothetical protein